MKVIEILKMGRNFLEVLHNSCIKMEDWKYIVPRCRHRHVP